MTLGLWHGASWLFVVWGGLHGIFLVIERLMKLPEFVRSYEPDGMTSQEFISYGATQRTLTQFAEIGWNQLESFQLS